MKEKHKLWMNVKWLPPQAGWVRLNTDRAANLPSGIAGGGGLVRLEDGSWVTGFSKFLGNTNAYLAELWAVYEGLCLLKDRGFLHVELQLDSQIGAKHFG